MAGYISKERKLIKKDKDISPPFKKEGIYPPGIEEQMLLKPRFLHECYRGADKLKDKIALVTGGDSGIGRSICLHYAIEGADVAFTYLPEELEDAEVTKKLIEEQGQQAKAIPVDFSEPNFAESTVEKVVLELGKIDILVNNAAYQNHLETIEELTVDQFEHTININLLGYFKMVKACLPHFNENACIINTSSILGYVGDENLIDYSATKAAIRSLTKSLAKSFRAKGIRVNAVAPGPVWTPLNPAERDYKEVKNFGQDTSFGRPAQPAEIAPAYVYLASEITGGFITGETINIFGSPSGAN